MDEKDSQKRVPPEGDVSACLRRSPRRAPWEESFSGHGTQLEQGANAHCSLGIKLPSGLSARESRHERCRTPAEIVERNVHPLTGKLRADSDPHGVREKFLPDRLPAAESPTDYDAAGNVQLEPEYADWFDSAENSGRDRAVLAETNGELRITSPLPGSVGDVKRVKKVTTPKAFASVGVTTACEGL